VRTFAGLNLCFVVMLLAVQGCSTTTSTSAPRPVVEKGSSAPVTTETPALVAPVQEKARKAAVSRQPPAVLALLEHAEQQANDGDLESSAASLERAIRINPGSAVLWYHLATLRLAQGEALQAEQLAVKSNSLAPGNTVQQARNWTLIAESRRQRGDSKGASLAGQRARELERH
jgi:tetratricopeptide (TPR) repeat protein